MLAELLAVDGVIEAMLRPGWLSPLDLIRLRGASSPLRALANSALTGLPPLVMLGAVNERADDDDESEAGDVASVSTIIRGFVMCWSSGRWVAAPTLNCKSGDQPDLAGSACHVLGPVPGATASWPVCLPPRRECLMLRESLNRGWAAEYSLASAAAAAATQDVGASLWHESTRAGDRDDAAILWQVADRRP